MLIQLNIKLHSGKIIPVAFRSGAFQGTFRDEFRNAWIPPEQVTTGMAILAEPPANFHSSGMHRIPPESPESGRNLWGTDKTSKHLPRAISSVFSSFFIINFSFLNGLGVNHKSEIPQKKAHMPNMAFILQTWQFQRPKMPTISQRLGLFHGTLVKNSRSRLVRLEYSHFSREVP